MAQPTSPPPRPPRRGAVAAWAGLGLLLAAVTARAAAGPLPTGMDLVVAALEQSVDGAFAEAKLPSVDADVPVLVRPQAQHAATWLVDHLLVDRLLARGYAVSLDSAATGPGGLQLTYRILDLKLSAHSGLLASGIRRQSKSSVAFALSRGDTLCWQGEYNGQVTDRIPKGRTDLLENPNPGYAFAQAEVKKESWGSFVEPLIVSTVLGGLIYLFFSSR